MFRILIIENVKTKAFHTMSPFYNSHFWCGRVYQGHKNILTSTLSRNRFLFPWETLWIGDQYWLKTRMWFFPLPIKIWGEFFDSHCSCEHDPIYGSLVIIVPVIRWQREVKKKSKVPTESWQINFKTGLSSKPFSHDLPFRNVPFNQRANCYHLGWLWSPTLTFLFNLENLISLHRPLFLKEELDLLFTMLLMYTFLIQVCFTYCII